MVCVQHVYCVIGVLLLIVGMLVVMVGMCICVCDYGVVVFVNNVVAMCLVWLVCCVMTCVDVCCCCDYGVVWLCWCWCVMRWLTTLW